MIVSEIMTRDVQMVTPRDTVRRAAQLMDELNVGALPVCNGGQLVGMITDRDITVRATAAGKGPEVTFISGVMSNDLIWCFETDDVKQVVQKMSDAQVRRIPVIGDNNELVGIVSLGDLATDNAPGTDTALKKISKPSEPNLQQS